VALITVCIPCYNRAPVLPALLDTVLGQSFDDYDVLIREDGSPQRAAIRAIVEVFQSRHPGRIRYIENARNLGYDGNIRALVEAATGEYCLFMGNDDLMCKDTLATVAGIIGRHPGLGVIVRSYAAFNGTPDNIDQTFRYFPDERVFAAGADAVAIAFRRSVVIPGMVLRRADAQAAATDRFDGVLLYQLYLVGRIAAHRPVVFTPQVLALYRNGGVPDFGNAEAERGKFVPTEHTPESSLHFMQGMVDIARHIEQVEGIAVHRRILADIGNYSYPILAIQAGKPLGVFLRYSLGLAKLGLWRIPLFYVWFGALLVLGPRTSEALIRRIKAHLGYTPALGGAGSRKG
jgi:glycosyltransferase involved in cell wall biosynthesis